MCSPTTTLLWLLPDCSDCRRNCRPSWAPWAFSCNSLRFPSLCLSPPRRWISQEVIDIFEGMRDDQALRMAANLGFKGPLQRQVMYAPGASNWMRRRGSGDLRGHKHTLTVAAAELPPRRVFEVSLLETAPPSCFLFFSLFVCHTMGRASVSELALLIVTTFDGS